MFIFASCVSTRQIGNLNMVSTRNIDSSEDYSLLRNYMGASKKEIKNTKAHTMEDAIDQVVRSTPGGEYLKNVKVYLVKNRYLAVEGDVWGISSNINFRGFKVGNKVKWTKLFKDYTGTIIELKDDKVCTVKSDSDQEIVEVEYDDLVKIGDN
jgi:hypothetical protein